MPLQQGGMSARVDWSENSSAWRYESGEGRLGYDARRRDEALQLAAACRRQDARWQKTAIGVLGRMPRLFGSLFGLTRMPKARPTLISGS